MTTQFKAEAPAFDTDADAALRKAYRTSEWRILPILFGLWMLAWVDRANVAFAKLQMAPDLGFSETAYGFGAGLFFLGYVLLGVPSAMVQRRVGARLTISVIALGWGATSVAMMFVHSAGMFYALRLLLGAFEAGFYPGVILYLNQWYPTQRRTRNFSIFHSAAICSTVAVGMTGGFVLDHMSGLLGVAGWRWMFLVQAVPTMILAGVAFRVLPDGPATARWLSEGQRRLILADLARSASQAISPTGKPVSLLANPMTWVLAAVYFGILAANSALSFFTPTILHDAGFGGYSAIGGVIAAICLLGAIGNIAFSSAVSRFRDSRLACAIASVVSVASILALPAIWHSRPGTFLTLVLALAGTGAGISLFWQIPVRFMDEATAALGVPLISSVANVAGFLTPWLIGYLRDMSGTYSGGFLTAASAQALAAALLITGIPLALRHLVAQAPGSKRA
ncbi:MFS transporter [Cupriavidus sp. RAF12]|uniref:MFS transporter n=1 Tax=Cupriavidus sp. RAF12 TaxID=3233050 RepID=UPI003F8DA6CA